MTLFYSAACPRQKFLVGQTVIWIPGECFKSCIGTVAVAKLQGRDTDCPYITYLVEVGGDFPGFAYCFEKDLEVYDG